MSRILELQVALLALVGCGSDNEGVCDPIAQTGCEGDQVCEVVQDQEEPVCFAPVSIRGQVFDLETDAAIEGARIVAVDINNAPVSAVAVSDASGEYVLDIPSTRMADGTPIAIELTLRADASGYQSFPAGRGCPRAPRYQPPRSS